MNESTLTISQLISDVLENKPKKLCPKQTW